MALPAKTRDACAGLAVSLAADYAEHTKGAPAWRLEWPVRRRHGNIIYHGIVDRVDRTDGAIGIMDYKIGQENERYAFQVRFYAWVLEAAGAGDVGRGSVIYLQKQSRRIEIDVSDVKRIGSIATLLGEAVDDCTYHASPGVVCETCDYRNACPYSVTDAAGKAT